VFPQTELGGDVGAVRAYGERVNELGFAHLLAYDHVVGADPAVHEGWNGPYDVTTTFHEPFVMFGYLAAVTTLELVTGIIILPQRQTALVAKQAAEVDLLTEGRFRLGVGIGWNAVEYEALGKDFTNRGKRLEEQIGLLRRLWTEPTVTFDGEHEQVTGAGLAPLPIQQPIPVWFGAVAPAALRRIGRLGDGWFPQVPPGKKLDEAWAIIRAAAVDAGRDPQSIGIDGRISWGDGGIDRLVQHAQRWRDAPVDQHDGRRPRFGGRPPLGACGSELSPRAPRRLSGASRLDAAAGAQPYVDAFGVQRARRADGRRQAVGVQQVVVDLQHSRAAQRPGGMVRLGARQAAAASAEQRPARGQEVVEVVELSGLVLGADLDDDA
jgi:probable F420-dependent oxidoreductase